MTKKESIPHALDGSGFLSIQPPSAAQPSRRLLSEEVVHRLGEMIIDGHLRPNEKLPSERQLAAQLGVSRTVVRDALAVLAERGMVEVRNGRGTFVCDGSQQATMNLLNVLVRRGHTSLPELLEARVLLEERVASLAAERAQEADLADLERTLAAMIENRRRPFAFVAADIAFHEALARAAKNSLLLTFLECIRGLLHEGMLMGTSVSGAMESSITEHREILDAIRARDPEAAQRAMGKHLQASRQQLTETGYLSQA